MRRSSIAPRSNWEKKVEELGLIFHHTREGVYWNESAYYEFSAKEIDVLEAATNELQRLCLLAGQNIVDNKRYEEFHIPETVASLIEWAWNAEPPAIYGRMDLAYDGKNPPKLLEYNADTPTGLLEAAVVQWYWLKERFPDKDQFNSIHERLVAKWTELKGYLSSDSALYFTHLDDREAEDSMTAIYLRDTAAQAGLDTKGTLIRDIGWDAGERCFVDISNHRMRSIFKLYPWEWLIHEEFGPHLLDTYKDVQWIEPIWKMIWSNKAILAVLWELFPNHPNLCEAYIGASKSMKEYARKPLLSREGANVTLRTTTTTEKTGGDYGKEGFVYQALAPVPDFNEMHPVIGSWVVDGESAGMGIRESKNRITNNMSMFVPHFFR